jgi:hypothetical protein
MKPQDLNLGALRKPLENALREYERLHDGKLTFQDFPDLVLTPDKPNSARTVIPAAYLGAKAGDMYAIVFLPGDGTGDAKTYPLGTLTIPPELRYSEKPERVIPRSKKGVVCEGFFPFFSFEGNHYNPDMFAASLDELTVDDVNNPRTIVRAWELGQRGTGLNPKAYFTTGTDKNGVRFADPHAMHYAAANARDVVQVVGFLTLTDKASHALTLTNNWTLPAGLE